MHKFLAALLLITSALLTVWIFPASRPLQPPLTFTQAEEVLANQWSPDETHLALLHKTGKLTIYDVQRQTYRQVQTAMHADEEECSLFYSPDGKLIGVASFTHPHIVLEIYVVASGHKTKHITFPVPVKDVQSIKAGWHPQKEMIVVGYTNEDYRPGLLQAVDLNSGKFHPIIHDAEEFAFSGSNIVILTSKSGSPHPILGLRVTPADSFKTIPVQLNGNLGQLRGFAAGDRGLYYTQRTVLGKTEKITVSFWRNEAGRFKPAWNKAFQFPARYDAWRDEILPAAENEWAAVTVIFGTDGMSGGHIWCVNKDNAIRIMDSNPNAYQMYPYGWQGRALVYNETSGYNVTTIWKDFRFDVNSHHRTVLPNAELAGENWGSISPRLKYIAVFHKEKEVAPWRLFIRPLDWCT